jgi:exosortase/archaeosortase
VKKDDITEGEVFGGMLRVVLVPVLIVYIAFTAYQYHIAPQHILNVGVRSARSTGEFNVTVEFEPWISYATVGVPVCLVCSCVTLGSHAVASVLRLARRPFLASRLPHVRVSSRQRTTRRGVLTGVLRFTCLARDRR